MREDTLDDMRDGTFSNCDNLNAFFGVSGLDLDNWRKFKAKTNIFLVLELQLSNKLLIRFHVIL